MVHATRPRDYRSPWTNLPPRQWHPFDTRPSTNVIRMAAGVEQGRGSADAVRGPCTHLQNPFCSTTVHDPVSSLGQKHARLEDKRQPSSLRGSQTATATLSGSEKSRLAREWLKPGAQPSSSTAELRCLWFPGIAFGLVRR